MTWPRPSAPRALWLAATAFGIVLLLAAGLLLAAQGRFDPRLALQGRNPFLVHPPAGPGGRFFTRPEMRLFVTYASWNTESQQAGIFGQGACPANTAAAQVYGCEKSGVTFGAQVESWW